MHYDKMLGNSWLVEDVLSHGLGQHVILEQEQLWRTEVESIILLSNTLFVDDGRDQVIISDI